MCIYLAMNIQDFEPIQHPLFRIYRELGILALLFHSPPPLKEMGRSRGTGKKIIVLLTQGNMKVVVMAYA